MAAALSVAFLAGSLTFGSTASAYIIDVGMADLAAKEKAENEKKLEKQRAEKKAAEQRAAKEKAAREKAEKEQRAAAAKEEKQRRDEKKKETKEERNVSLLQDKAAETPAKKQEQKTANNDAKKAMDEAAKASTPPVQQKKEEEPKLPVQNKKADEPKAPVQNNKTSEPKVHAQEKKQEGSYKGSNEFIKVKKNPEGERFQEIFRDPSFVYYMDMQSVRYVPVPNRQEKMIDVWVKLKPSGFSDDADSKAGRYYLEHYYINPQNKQIQFLCELEVTGRPSNAIKERPYSSQNWENLVPGSVEDDIYHAVVKRVKSSSGIGGAMNSPTLSDVFDALNIGL